MTMMIALLLQAASPPIPPSDVAKDDIVITGQSIADRQKALNACIARRCSPDRDIHASLALASRQFIEGEYAEARHTLLVSRGRNARFAAEYPTQVADLHRGLVTMSGLDGQPYSARISTFDATGALKSGLPTDDHRILLQRLETGDQLASESEIADAIKIYDDVAAKAHDVADTKVEAIAMFRAAALYAVVAGTYSEYRGAARRRAALIERRTEPEFGEFRDAIALVTVKLAAFKARPDGRSRIIANSRVPAMDQAILLSEPLNKYIGSNIGLSGNTGASPEWVDVAFWVRPDGSVSTPQVINQSKKKPGPWLDVKVKAVGNRRYAPLKRNADDPGIFLVERYTMVHNVQSNTGSFMRSRALRGTLFTTDLTNSRPTPSTRLQ